MATVASQQMQPSGRMTYLMTVAGSFHGRVVAARLGAAGILVELRGLSEGPYPLPGKVELFVRADQLDDARELLLADAVDAAFEERAADVELPGDEHSGGELPVSPGDLEPADAAAWSRRRRRRIARAITMCMIVLLLVAGVLASFH